MIKIQKIAKLLFAIGLLNLLCDPGKQCGFGGCYDTSWLVLLFSLAFFFFGGSLYLFSKGKRINNT